MKKYIVRIGSVIIVVLWKTLNKEEVESYQIEYNLEGTVFAVSAEQNYMQIVQENGEELGMISEYKY